MLPGRLTKMSEVAMQRGAPGRYCAFGPYIIDLVGGLLWRDGAVLHLRPKDVEILITLIESRDRVVEKSEIFERVWPGVIVEENNIARRISELRRVLGEDAGERTFVATAPGRGYRFVAEVTELTELPWVPARAHPRNVAPAPAATPIEPSRGSSIAAWKRGVPVGLLSALGVIAVFAGLGRFAPPTVAAPSVARQFTFGSQLQQQPVWSPDGQLIAYASASGGNSDIWVQHAADSDPVRITTSPAHDWQPSWSPDGAWLAFRSERDGGGIWVVRKDGEQEHLLIRRGAAPQWSPDGKWILFSFGDGRSSTAWPHVVSSAGGVDRPLLEDVLAGSANKYAGWHPDGRVSVWFRDERGSWKFITTPATGGPVVASDISADVERGLTNAGIGLSGLDYPFSRLERFVWAPSGRSLYFEAITEGARSIWRISVDPRTLAWKRGPDPVTTGVGRHAQIAMSADGDRLAFTAQAARTRVWAIPLDSSGRQSGAGAPLTPGRDTEVYTRATPDGRVLVYRSVQGSRNEFKILEAARRPRSTGP